MDSEKEYAANVEYVAGRLDKRTLLEQLAEECNELGKAALKLIRAEGLNENWTERCLDDCKEDLYEEVCDVVAVLDVLGIGTNKREKVRQYKMKRWAGRLQKAEAEKEANGEKHR